MRVLRVDIESFSSADLKKVGVYRYAEAPDFQVLLFGYAFDADPVRVVDLARGEADLRPLDGRERGMELLGEGFGRISGLRPAHGTGGSWQQNGRCCGGHG